MSDIEKMLSAQEVADKMGVSIQTIIRLLKSGDLNGSKVGIQWRIAPSAVLEWLGEDGVDQNKYPAEI